MLVSIVLTLTSETNAKLPAHLGRPNYAETLERLDWVDPGLASDLHSLEGLKPLTCSGLFGNLEPREGWAQIRTHETYWLRMTGLTERVSAALLEGFWGRRPTDWCLAGHRFTVLNVFCNAAHHPWSGADDYQTLAERHLLDGASAAHMNQVTLEFASPTAFKSKAMPMPLPLPGLVWGNLIDRWNRFSSVELNPQMRDFGELAVEIGRFDLHSVLLEQKNKSWRVGAMGRATYRTQQRDRYWLGLLQMLAEFARYSGVGVQTSTGMGQVRRV